MQKFITLSSNICPLDIPNVDTDQIIPKQFLKRIERTGFGQFLFYDWRFHTVNQQEELNMDFSLNQAKYKNAKILLAQDNFGCGSSREHAPWSLLDYGFSCIIAPSFADIFYNNCFQNGILPIILNQEIIQKLFLLVEQNPQQLFTVDLPNNKIYNEDKNFQIDFSIESSKKEKLLKGLDDIGFTLQFEEQISNYESYL